MSTRSPQRPSVPVQSTGVPLAALEPSGAAAYEQVAVPIVVIGDFDRPTLAFNAAAKAFFGIGADAERFFIKDYYRLANRDELERGFAALANGDEASLRLELRRADGRWFGATLIARPVPRGETPSIGAAVTVVLDSVTVEPPHRAGDADGETDGDLGDGPVQLRVFRDALWTSRELAISVSEDYTTDHLVWNRTMFELLDLDPARETPSSELFFSCVHPEDRERIIELSKAIVTGEIDEWYDGCRLVTADGRVKHVSGHGLTALDPAGRRALVGILVDVTEAHDRAAQAKYALTDLERMTAAVSHDLRAPVRHLESFCEMMTETIGDRLVGDDAIVFGFAKESIVKLGGMIEAMVEFSRLPKDIPSREAVDLGAAATRIAEEHFPEAAGRIRIGSLPTVAGDPALLTRLLRHLIDNAVKFSRDRPDDLIEVTGRIRGKDYAVVEVTDRGAGFDQRYVGKLFQMFQRLHSAEEFPGFGTGLAIADRIAQLHGGRLSGESAEGRTTFTLELPLPRGIAQAVEA